MKKTGILNYKIEEYLSKIGHTQTLVICDPGLPIPQDRDVIDISLLPGIPSFMQVLTAVAEEMKIEKYFYASEIKDKNNQLLANINSVLGGITSEEVSHETLKKMSKDSLVFIRTGECSAYANVLLVAGVTF